MTIRQTLLQALCNACWTEREKLRKVIIEHLVDADNQAFCDLSRSAMSDVYVEKIRNGCVGYEKMDDAQLSQEVEDSNDFEDVESVKEYFELD